MVFAAEVRPPTSKDEIHDAQSEIELEEVSQASK